MASDVVLPELMSMLFGRIRDELSAEALGDLRISHVRVMTGVPAEGISVTTLARAIGMTKQGCGQFVTQLEGSGHLRTSPGTADRRVRMVHLTPTGDRFLAAVRADVASLERRFAEEVGARRFATFKKVLKELAGTGTSPRPRSART